MQPFPTTSREILALIGDRATFNRGKRYANQGRVQLTSPPEGDHTTNGRLRWECSVLGSKEYRVILEDHQGNLERLSCSCPAFGRMGVCKHIAAALLYLLEHGFLEPDVDPAGQRRIGHRSSAVLENTPAPEDEGGIVVGPKPRDDHTTSARKPRATRANQTREEEFQKNRTAVTGLIQRLEDLLELEHQPSRTSTGPVPAPGRQVTSHLSIEYILVHEGHVSLELKAGVDRTFVVKNIRDFIRDVQIGTPTP